MTWTRYLAAAAILAAPLPGTGRAGLVVTLDDDGTGGTDEGPAFAAAECFSSDIAAETATS